MRSVLLGLAPPEPLHWNPHVEQLREAGWMEPQKIYQRLVETPDPLGRSVGRMVAIFCEAMERAKKNVEEAREASREHAGSLRLEISTAAACNGDACEPTQETSAP